LEGLYLRAVLVAVKEIQLAVLLQRVATVVL
jgi:hypothetical protein